MVFIASYWTEDSPTDVRVFSNCEEVELYLNDALIERRGPDQDRISTAIAHPPFTFALGSYEPGTLEAAAYLEEKEAARHVVRTPGPVRQLDLWIDDGGRRFARSGKDVVVVHAELKDEAGTLVPDAWENVSFGATGGGALVGANPFSSDAGIASILLQADTAAPDATVYALATVKAGDVFYVLSAAVGSDIQPFEVHVTTDGSAPDSASLRYSQPVEAERVRAVLVVDSEQVVQADSNQKRFRIQGSTAP